MTLNPVTVPMRPLTLGLSTALLLLAAPAAGAQTLTFDAAACSGGGFDWFQGFVENGLQLTSPGGFGTWCSDNPAYAGSPSIFIDGYNQMATLSAVGGGTFTLSSIELAPALFSGIGGTVWFTGALEGGGLIGTSFDFPTAVSSPSFTPFFFGAAWTGLTSVTWSQAATIADGFHQFDGINATADSYGTRMIELLVLEEPTTGPTETVPEPATMTLLATGLVGMSFARRRRRG